ncbi:hypothetical protein RND81_14G218000 [Saponaria officinalis]|uniref:Uncharacterized protein n=1 Tax=Saponaria officinalis TaxID=3572 RepID=A0AAW1GUY7_SAPOF
MTLASFDYRAGDCLVDVLDRINLLRVHQFFCAGLAAYFFPYNSTDVLVSTLWDSQEECSMLTTYKINTADSICPSKARAMLASRACGSSIMIGDALGINKMHKVTCTSLLSVINLISSFICWR